MGIMVNIKGAIKTQGIPDSACFTTFADLLRSLQDYLVVDLPEKDLSNVIIGNEQPGDSDRNKIWVRRANSGQVIGLYVYSAGAWVPLSPAPQQVYWFYGDSREVTNGFRLIDSTNPILPSTAISALINQYIPDTTNTYFVYYAANFVGI